VKLIAAICPRCGASLNMPEGSQKLYCMYCGTQIIVGKVDSERIQCNVCQGYGRVDICRACSGSGNCTWSTRSPGYRGRDILAIGFSAYCEDGMCSACGGSGRYMLGGCPGCNGTGRCPQCLGTGKCQACHGVGNIPNPNGYERCNVCGGSGLMDAGSPKSPEPPTIGECPQCGKMLHDDNPTCPHCGFTRRSCPGCGAPWVPRATFCGKCGFGKSPEQQKE